MTTGLSEPLVSNPSTLFEVNSMFEAAVTKFAKTVGDDVLLPVPSLTDGDKCNVLNLVVKKNRRWFWQSPKYEPTGFTLQDILKDNGANNAPIKTSELLPAYEKTNKLSVKGKLGGKLKGLLELEVAGSDSIDLETKFGKVNKSEISAKDVLQLADKK